MPLTESFNRTLSAVMFPLKSTHQTTIQATSMQLVFGRDSILNIKVEGHYQLIEKKQKMIEYNNTRENAKRIIHVYKKGDKVWLDVHNATKAKYAKTPYEQPPYKKLKVNNNGTA